MPISSTALAARTARLADAAAITAIYNQGIEDRIGTFETEPRAVADIEAWFDPAKAFVAVENATGEVVGYAIAHPYADRCCYAGIGEFSVYVRRDRRGAGVGRVAMAALVDASRAAGLWKLLSRVFPENRSSLNLMAWSGFKEIGLHEKHGKLDGVWRDCVIVERVIPENLD
ncbi:arsinothricin resistance N-acetyltransferase ArsN1 family A [Phenylobacterium sp.]|uniref:arsinothricin resistance N-acetyltransferase ArsN1 family A n=1 Tax=Phenylobacterium sp. TaxID=1871053 RepID=UPI00356B34F3